MAFTPIQDKISKRTSRTISKFHGCHYGYYKTKQPDQFAATSDLMFPDQKPQLRPGMRKNQQTGYNTNITSLFPIHLGSRDFIGSIQNGILTAYPMEDVLAAQRKYYTWNEVESGWTWQELLDGETWNSILTGR